MDELLAQWLEKNPGVQQLKGALTSIMVMNAITILLLFYLLSRKR